MSGVEPGLPGTAFARELARRERLEASQRRLDLNFLQRAVDVATGNVLQDGGPFGAVLVTERGRVFSSGNRVTASSDPTAHAEVSVIRLAASSLGTFDLSGSTLYSSCEPCPMCFAACQWARLDRVLFAATAEDAAAAGFDDSAFYRMIRGQEPASTPVVHAEGTEAVPVDALAPFRAWDLQADRIDY